jgi:hypothetical protein
MAIFAVGSLLFVTACQDKSTSRFVPPSASARQALETALNAWKSGQPMTRIEGKPLIDPVDSNWQAGQKLASFEISSEDTNPEGHRRINVKLTMQQPAGTVNAKYVVLGDNPISVFREEDYQKLSGQ